MNTTNQQHGPAGRDWLRHQAEAEERCGSVSVGGLASDLDMIKPFGEAEAITRSAFSLLVHLTRRKQGLTPERLAEVADVDLAEVVAIEMGDELSPEPRTVYKLADALKLPETRMMELAGLIRRNDSRLESAAVRFAARSESMERLTKEEERALSEFVKVLSDMSHGD